ncbi:MAG: amidohydrolase family protein [Armatimonadota bacterium]|nr:amidohydrolase family protein [Armatimonadota bacterium]
MAIDLVIRRARLRGREGLWDVGLAGGRIAAVAPTTDERGREEIDAAGGLVTPTFVNPHVHLDKTMLGDVMRPNVSQTLQEAIQITWDFKRAYTDDDIVGRAGPVVEAAVAYGTTILRAFADVDSITGLRAVRGLLALRERYGGVAEIQVVAFPQEGIIRDPGTDRLLREAMALGADVVGGLPWYERTDEQMRRHIDVVFEIAQAADADIHMLVDDTDDPNARSLEYLAVKTLEAGYRGRVTASHCGALAAYNDTYAAKVIGMVAEAGITICSNPHISLVLAGRRDREPVRRGITRVRELLAAGVNVASGQDDVNDPYYPFGRNSQAEVALFMAHTAHLTYPDEIERCFDMVTTNAARALRRDGYGCAPGDRADLNVWRAPSVREVLRLQQPPAYVLKDGRILTAWTWRVEHRWGAAGAV